jgi:hypothetical protein
MRAFGHLRKIIHHQITKKVLSMRVLDHLINAVRKAAIFNPEVQAAPACILWPDRDRQWEGVIPILQPELPE